MTNVTQTVAFTGHRPDKIKNGQTENGEQVLRIKQELRSAILKKIEEGCTSFLSGMAMGADLWAAKIVLELKQQHPQISLTAVVPFEGQANRFPTSWKKRYQSVLLQCDEVHVLSPTYYRSCYQSRNRWLVEHAGHLIAVYNGSRGGTMQTLNHALINGCDVTIIHC